MKKATGKEQQQADVQSKVFSKQEVEVFKRVFDKIAKGGQIIPVQSYVKHVKQMSQGKDDGIMTLIVKDLENEGDTEVSFKEFVGLLEEKVGDLTTQNGLQRIFTFITRDPIKKRVTLEDLQRIRTELGLGVSDKELQRLVNFVTVSYKERSDFTFDEFEKYALKNQA